MDLGAGKKTSVKDCGSGIVFLSRDQSLVNLRGTGGDEDERKVRMENRVGSAYISNNKPNALLNGRFWGKRTGGKEHMSLGVSCM